MRRPEFRGDQFGLRSSKRDQLTMSKESVIAKGLLPPIPALRESLQQLQVVETASDDVEGIAIVPANSIAVDHGGPFATKPGIFLTQVRKSPISVEKLVDRIVEGLSKCRHVHSAQESRSSRTLAAQIAGIASMLRSAKSDVLDNVNVLLQNVSDARVGTWAILPALSKSSAEYRFGEFSHGVIDCNELSARCAHAGSDFFEKWGKPLRNRLCIKREEHPLRAIALNSLAGISFHENEKRIFYRICDEYHATIAAAEREQFLREIDRIQAVFGAAGLGTISSEFLRNELVRWIIVINREKRQHGWVVPLQQTLHVTVTHPNALATCLASILDRLKLADFGGRSLDVVIQRYAEYLQLSRQFEGNERLEDALLHLVYALDLMLGGEADEKLTSVLAGRAAILSQHTVSVGVKDLETFLRECYDMRSGYAHRGQRGELDSGASGMTLTDRFQRLLQIARAVLGAACFARQQEWCIGEDAKKRWVGRIDVARKKIEAGYALDEQDFASLGINRLQLCEGQVPAVQIEW